MRFACGFDLIIYNFDKTKGEKNNIMKVNYSCYLKLKYL